MASVEAHPHTFAPPLELSDIHYSVGEHQILRGIDLTVAPREVLCLLGPSGCGKTTLLRIAAGIERQTRGVVRVAGRVVADDRTYQPAEERALGLVFQDLALFPHMRVLDNVTYGLSGGRGKARERARAALEQVGLSGYENAFPHQLSGGEQQRVALVRALVPRPSVVLFDEPFSGLDRDLRQSVREDMLSVLHQSNATAVIVTHDPEEALAMADRIALMRDGRIVQTATPFHIWQHPVDLKAARVFSHVNAFHSRVTGDVVETPVGNVPSTGAEDGASVTIGFRPEGIKVVPNDAPEGFTATIVRRRYFGSYTALAVAVNGTQLDVHAEARPFMEGETVKIVPRLGHAIVLPGHQ